MGACVCWRRVSNAAAEGDGVCVWRGGGVAEWDSGILWPSLSEGFHSPWCRHFYPLLSRPSSSSTKRPTSHDRGHSFLLSYCSLDRKPHSKAISCRKGPPWFPCSLGPAWRTPGPSLVWPPPFWTWLQILGCKPAGTDGCRLEGQAAPREVILTEGRPRACSWCGGLSCGHHEPRTGPCRKMRSGRLEQVEPSFSQVCPCVCVQLSSAHSSPKQSSNLLQNWNQLQA